MGEGNELARPPAVPRRGVGRLVNNCQRAFQGELERTLKPHGVTPSHWHHLNELWSEDGLTQVELSGRLGIEKASSTRILDDLEKRGLIRRQRVVTDRRKVANRLSSKGRALTARLIEEVIALNARSQAGVGAADMKTFLAVLAALTRNLQGPDKISPSRPPPAP